VTTLHLRFFRQIDGLNRVLGESVPVHRPRIGHRNWPVLLPRQILRPDGGGLAEREKERRTHGKSIKLLTGAGLLMEGTEIIETIARKMLTLDYTPGCSFLERRQADANWHHCKKDWAQH
jgi:hypothetical protein